MNVNQTALQDFYREHSFITDPGNYADYFLDLPLDLFSLKEVIHGLFFHGRPIKVILLNL